MASNTTLIGAVALAVGIAAVVSFLLRAKVDAREPPAIHPMIPFFGHIIGMLREGPLYIARVSAHTKAPIFTLPVLGSSTYVCQSPHYASLIQRASSTLDFDGIVMNITPRMVGLNAHTSKIIATDKDLIKVSHTVINTPLMAQNIGAVTATQLEHFSNFVNKIEDGQVVELFRFVTREVTAATMHSFYGPRNPFAVDPTLIDAFWEWEREIVAYMTCIFPSIFARKARNGLDRCAKGFEAYDRAGGYADAYSLLQNRRELLLKTGISPSELARLELSICFGFNSNASITTFWALNNIFSRPTLLAALRAELTAHALVAPGTLSFPNLRDACPLLNSIYKETLRLIAPMMSARLVTEDTLLADTYLLRRGAVVQIAGGIMHKDAAIWGPDVAAFNPRRFVHCWNGSKTTDARGTVSDAKADQVHSAAFRGFGGGTSLCPGRFIAQMEIISLVAVIVAGFDLVAPEGKSEVAWDPPRDDKRFPFAVVKPLRELPVRMKRREGMEGLKWMIQA